MKPTDYFKIFTARAITRPDRPRRSGLNRHRQFRPMLKRHDISRAERSGVCEAQIEVMENVGRHSGGAIRGFSFSGKAEWGTVAHAETEPQDPAVEDPVQEAKLTMMSSQTTNPTGGARLPNSSLVRLG